MTTRKSRRHFLYELGRSASAAAVLAVLPPSIRAALAIPAARRTGTIADVEHIVVLMLENRSFDHYFGTMQGVRGFGDRFPVPLSHPGSLEGSPAGSVPAQRTVWYQHDKGADATNAVVTPFRLDTAKDFKAMRVTGTPHVWSNAQEAWANGSMDAWPTFKLAHSMAYFGETDLPFQFALANAFTIADAYHCSFQGGTNPNRIYLFSGTVDPQRTGDGPAIGNLYNTIRGGNARGGYGWTTYPERLEAAGISWRIYQNMEIDYFALNPLVGFKRYRDAYNEMPDAQMALKNKALTTCDVAQLKQDVLNNNLPQVAWICPTAAGSEHPGPSSPAQGAQYTADVLDALTADPAVWAKTVLLIMFDENDGFFDHVPPPAVPSIADGNSRIASSHYAGGSTVDTSGEYHDSKSTESDDSVKFMHAPYGLGPRVPMYAVSPWSKGGWVSSEVFDHTSVIRFIEKRFGVFEPNISPWRRAVCGDLTSLFDFNEPESLDFIGQLPSVRALARRAAGLRDTWTPPIPPLPELPFQHRGIRPSRKLPYELTVESQVDLVAQKLEIAFINTGKAAAVFHVYDRRHLEQIPRRYTVGPGASLSGFWSVAKDSGYDIWVLGPGGFHRHLAGKNILNALGFAHPEVRLSYDAIAGDVRLTLANKASNEATFSIRENEYGDGTVGRILVAAHKEHDQFYSLQKSGFWYDLSVTVAKSPGFLRRFAGRMEVSHHLTSDPAVGGRAIGEQYEV